MGPALECVVQAQALGGAVLAQALVWVVHAQHVMGQSLPKLEAAGHWMILVAPLNEAAAARLCPVRRLVLFVEEYKGMSLP